MKSRCNLTAVSAKFCPAVPPMVALIIVVAVGAFVTGCSGFLKPTHTTARHFVLTPLPVAAPANAVSSAKAVGVGQVKIPAYLNETSLAVRNGTNEIGYLPLVLWAEHLDDGVQRVLAANLGTLLATDQIRLSSWRSSDVSAEVYVAIEQFDLDSNGRGLLVARWRILAPGSERTLKTGETRLEQKGPSPSANPSGAVATLSDLVADLSRQLAKALQEAQ